VKSVEFESDCLLRVHGAVLADQLPDFSPYQYHTSKADFMPESRQFCMLNSSGE